MRTLTANERAVLTHVVLDPDVWWTHVNNQNGQGGKRVIDHEAALAAKVSRWQDSYDAAVAIAGYQTRAEREAA